MSQPFTSPIPALSVFGEARLTSEEWLEATRATSRLRSLVLDAVAAAVLLVLVVAIEAALGGTSVILPSIVVAVLALVVYLAVAQATGPRLAARRLARPTTPLMRWALHPDGIVVAVPHGWRGRLAWAQVQSLHQGRTLLLVHLGGGHGVAPVPLRCLRPEDRTRALAWAVGGGVLVTGGDAV